MPVGDNEIGLQDLIFQIKRELLAPNPRVRAEDPYPLLAIDHVELEVEVKISKTGGGGIAISVLGAELSASRTTEQSRGHVVRISLSPLLSREELIAEARRDPELQKAITRQAQQALLKGGGLAGQPE